MVELFPTNAHLEMHDIVEIDTNSKLEMWFSNIYIYFRNWNITSILFELNKLKSIIIFTELNSYYNGNLLLKDKKKILD